MEKRLLFLVDIDNTLLDNDRIRKEIKRSLVKVLGQKEAGDFWLQH